MLLHILWLLVVVTMEWVTFWLLRMMGYGGRQRGGISSSAACRTDEKWGMGNGGARVVVGTFVLSIALSSSLDEPDPQYLFFVFPSGEGRRHVLTFKRTEIADINSILGIWAACQTFGSWIRSTFAAVHLIHICGTAIHNQQPRHVSAPSFISP